VILKLPTYLGESLVDLPKLASEVLEFLVILPDLHNEF